MRQKYLKKIFKICVSLTLTFLLIIGILNGTRIFSVSKAESLPTAHFEGMSGIQGMSENELYEKTNTYKYNGSYTGEASQDSYEYRQYQYYDMSKKVELPYEIMEGDPQITVLTHGMGSDASHWSNKLISPGEVKFAYDADSLISQLNFMAGGANVYWAKMESEHSFYLINLNDENNIYENGTYKSNDEQAIGTTQITDISKHIIIVFESNNPNGYNNPVYEEFNFMLSKIIYDVKYLNGGKLPKVNLVAHSRGGLTNLQYTLDHPELVASVFSMGTPYLGSTTADTEIGRLVARNSQGLDDIIDKNIYEKYYERWTENNSLYANINVHALGGYSTTDYLVDLLINNKDLVNSALNASITENQLKLLKNALNIFSSEWVGNVLKKIISNNDETIDVLMADINIATDILDSKYIPVISWVKEKYGVFNNDLLVNLYSQWGRSNLLKEADKDYHFQLYSKGTWNANGKRSNPTQPPVVHNLEARDPDFINYILKNIEIGNGENQFLYRPIGNDIEVYGYRGKVFEGTTFILPETLDGHTVVGIGRKAFDRGFTNNVITQVIIPETVTNIDDYAFFGCTDLETISFEGTSQLQRIGAYAFSGCEKLSRFNSQSGGVITIPSAVTELEINAFSGLENVQYVSIPADVSYIGEMAFAFMPKLTSITVASSNANYMSYMGNLYNKDGWLMQYTVGSPATTFSVPTSVSGKTITNIGMYAFAGANRLTVIDFNRVESIGEYAFKDCTSLSSYSGGAGIEYVAAGAFDDTLITGNEKGFWAFGKFLYKYDGNSQIISKDMFPSAVTKIGEFAFLENETLEEVYLPLNVDFIGDYAFAFCNNLKKVQYENFVLPFINNSIFIGLNDEFKFYCAKSLADGIEDNQKWGQYASIVESIKTLAYFEDVNETLTFYYGESTALPTKQVENYYNKGWHEVIGENNGQPVIDTERLGVVTWGRTDAAITYKADLMAIESYNLILRNGPISDEDKALITIQISIGDTYSFSKDGYEINGNYTAFNEVQKDILSHYYYQGIYAPNEFGSIEEAYCHYNGWVLNVNGEIKAIPNSGQWLEYYQQLVMSLCVDWLPVEYSCVCNYNDGSGRSETLTYTYFSDDSFPTITRTDYELQGWQNSSGVILPKLGGFIGNITVTAKWSPHLYTITCKSTTRVIKTIEVKGARNTYVNLPTLTSGYYYVSSWGTHSVNTPYKVEGNITLTAVWKGTEYSIIYKNRMDNVYVRQFSYEYGKVTILDDPYNLTSTITFEGFYRDENFTQSITKISASEHGNITIYIKWKFSCGLYFRGEEVKITDSGRWNQPYDRVNIVHNKLSAVDYSKYKSIQFIINIEIWEEDDGYQYLMLYDQYNSNTGIEIWGTEINHKPSGKSSEHHTYQFIFNIPWNASKIQNNVYQDTFYLLYGASGAWDDDWRNSNCYVSCFLSVDEPNATTNGSVSWG